MGIVLLLVAGLIFGCGSAIKELGLVFDNPADAGRPSPSFNADIAPILTDRCAIAECHVVDGPHDIDLRTYDSVIKGGDEGAIVIAADAMESEMVEEIAEGKMPLKVHPWRQPRSNSSSIGLMRVPRITKLYQK